MAKYLIVGPSWVGDMVMAQSLFISLRQQDPEAIIDVVGTPWSLPVLGRMPEVRRPISLDVKHGQWALAARRALGRSLRNEGYDKAIVLPRSLKSALVPFFAQIKHRVGYHGEQRFVLLTERRSLDKTVLNQTVKRFVSLGLPLSQAYPPAVTPFPVLKVDTDNQQQLFSSLGLAQSRPAVALMPGAEYGPAKQWPLAYFRELADNLVNQGKQVWVLGGPKDRADADIICNGVANNIYNLCGQTKLVDVVDLLAATERVVTNDSGLMHIAAAVGTQVHGIYGSTSEAFTPALTEHFVAHNLHLHCSPCFQRTCPLGHTHCLHQLKPNTILKSLS